MHYSADRVYIYKHAGYPSLPFCIWTESSLMRFHQSRLELIQISGQKLQTFRGDPQLLSFTDQILTCVAPCLLIQFVRLEIMPPERFIARERIDTFVVG